MTDRRQLKSNGEVADRSLKGQIQAKRFVTPRLARVAAPVTSILPGPENGAPRDRELAFGEGFEVLDTGIEYAFGYAARDGYVGYVLRDDLAFVDLTPTHRVVLNSYWAAEPALKQPDPAEPMPMGALVHVTGVTRDHCDWAEVSLPDPETGDVWTVHMPMPHLVPLGTGSDPKPDLVEEAARYLGVPYLWGGNSGFGLDCSGLVQAACLACGVACPGDSDQQARDLGQALADDAEPERGDLLFWKGHVALVVGDGRILHANAHHMAVAYEDMSAAMARIAASDGPVTARRRIGRGAKRV